MNFARIVMIAMLIGLSGCGRSPARPRSLTLATTTSTQDSGLLDELVPLFRRRAGIEVKVVAVGSGQALQLGGRGDADVLLVHSPIAEREFMAKGLGESRRAVMTTDFVLVGPKDDPAGVGEAEGIADAFRAIARGKFAFASRGDDSGTHQKELALWKAAGIEPVGGWYLRSGSGMAQTLRLADEKRAYTLADRATYLALRANSGLVILSRRDQRLLNQYSVIVVSPRAHPGIHGKEAREFADFLLSPEARAEISKFGVKRFGGSLFTPTVELQPATH